VSLLAHEFDEQPVVLALCADYVLRVWSVQVRDLLSDFLLGLKCLFVCCLQLSQCVMSHDLSDYLLNRDEADTANLEGQWNW